LTSCEDKGHPLILLDNFKKKEECFVCVFSLTRP